MKKRVLTGIIAAASLMMAGCGDQEQLTSGSEAAPTEATAADEETTAAETDTAVSADTTSSPETTVPTDTTNDTDQVWSDQKIVFMMWIASFDEPYSKGYFIDGKGMKHVYERPDTKPMYPVEDEYAYLIEHYDEFESMEYFDDETLKQCAECLYQVNADAEVITEGTAIADAPEKSLYGVRMKDGREEFVFLGSEPGISKRLDDPSADEIFELFGDKWYLQ